MHLPHKRQVDKDGEHLAGLRAAMRGVLLLHLHLLKLILTLRTTTMKVGKGRSVLLFGCGLAFVCDFLVSF
jgi:hypothetical protein